jgi:radical SAM protein with 4Fe4S-binding SPASM domain
MADHLAETVATWIPPAVPHLVLRERDSRWLCLNPDVPSWLVSNRAGSLLLRLADGQRSIQDICALLDAAGIGVADRHVADFFLAARSAGLFAHGVDPQDPLTAWDGRGLGAVHLHLTNRCNLECVYCFRESTPRLAVHLTADHFVEALQRMAPRATGGLTVTFTGGEPLLFPGFETVVEASTQLGYHNLLLTNGTLISTERAAFIARHFEDVTISLDGPTESIHAATRGAGNFKGVIRGIGRLVDAGASVRVKVTVAQSNLGHCHEISDVLPPGVPVQFVPLMPMGRGQQVPATDYIDDEAFTGLNRGLARVTEGRLASQYVPGQRTRRCHAGAYNISIADTGDVYPCHLFHQEAFRLGNIFQESFDEIFDGARNREYVASMDVEANNSICAACEVRFLCGGGCKANALHSSGDHRGVDRYCGYLKTTIVDDLFRSCGVEVEPRGGDDAPPTSVRMPVMLGSIGRRPVDRDDGPTSTSA